MRRPSGSLLPCTCMREPSLVVVKEMCASPRMISSSCRPTLSGGGQFWSSSFRICRYAEETLYQILIVRGQHMTRYGKDVSSEA